MSRAPERAIANAAELFNALGDGTRLALVMRLSDGLALTATQLADGAKVSRQAIMKHLRVLEDAGIVTRVEEGRAVLYALDVVRVDAAQAFLAQVSTSWDAAIARLKKLVET